ncbi:MAG TPA: hypothetical protein VGU67_14360 [Edaphobacter sp.]|nr:hypothetical protein [Edaphobacter sp.]
MAGRKCLFGLLFVTIVFSHNQTSAQCPKVLIDPSLPTPLVISWDPTSGLIYGKFSAQDTLPDASKNATLRLCIDGKENLTSKPILPDKTFVIQGVLKDAKKITVQVVSTQGNTITYGPESTPAPSEGTQYIFVGGVEQSGYSSQALSTEPFIQIYIEGPVHSRQLSNKKFLSVDAWGRVRLLGAPQPSTNGIASTFTDPTGTITKQDFTKVGQSMDVIGGGQIFVNKMSSSFGQLSLIAWAGTTTPLSSQNVAYTFKTPAVNTLECQQLLIKFTRATGYSPGLTADPSGKVCIANGTTAVTDIAFANQDRTNFLFKWGAGIRTQAAVSCTTNRVDCIKALALLDVTVGQDATVTRGLVRHFLAKADGLLPIPTGNNTAYLYLFGSVYTRFTRNRNSAPLILAAETAQPSLPSPSVIVLPLVQPDRDYFRLGVGLNLKQIFQKMFSPSTSQ